MDVDLLINIGILVGSTIGALTAVIGNTWDNSKSWAYKLTIQGWIAVLCLSSALTLGIIKEHRATIKSKQLALNEEKLKRDLADAKLILSIQQEKEDLLTSKLEAESFDFGLHKIIYIQLSKVIEYRRGDDSWASEEKFKEAEEAVNKLMQRLIRLGRLLEPAIKIDLKLNSLEIMELLDDIIQRLHAGRVKNAYEIGQILGVMQIESTKKPDGGKFSMPVLSGAFSNLNKEIYSNGKILLPDKKELRDTVSRLLNHVSQDTVPPKDELQQMLNKIRTGYNL